MQVRAAAAFSGGGGGRGRPAALCRAGGEVPVRSPAEGILVVRKEAGPRLWDETIDWIERDAGAS